MALRRYKPILWIIVLIALASCYPEWRLARSYIDSDPEVSILVLPTNYIFKKNLKVDELEQSSGLSDAQLDSALMANSIFLQNISDSIFLENFVNSMIDEFMKLGYKVYTEQMLDSFLFVKPGAYILNIAQIELEEHYNVHEDKQEFDDYIYFKSVDLDAISYNFWFEMSAVNNDAEEHKLFYASETINDVVYGYFTENMFTGDIKYKYNVDEIDVDIIYQYSAYFGRRFAGYTYDYLMNRYIEEHWPPDKNLRFYMQYKRENNTLDPTINDRFMELDP
jgi:hypothetical protein